MTAWIDAEVRRRAAAEIGRSWNVEAGAGTGKTTLLVQRVVERVKAGGSPSRLAVITFTRAAAGELERRIRQGFAREREASADAERWQRAERELGAAQISTIHGFCGWLLRRFPIEAGVDPLFRSADEGGDERAAFVRAFRRWTADTFSSDGSGRSLAGLLRIGTRLRDFEDLFAQLAGRGSARIAWDSQPDPWPLVGEFRQRLAQLVAQHRDCRDPADMLAQGIAATMASWHGVDDLADDELGFRLFALGKAIPIRRKLGQAKNWAGGKDQVERIRTEVDDMAADRDLPNNWMARFERAFGAWLLGDLPPHLERFRLQLEDDRRREGLLSFDELLVKARDLLAHSTTVRAELAADLDAILVDEFQDTDPIQVEIVAALTELSAAHVPGKLFLVGDPKQSIYRFRGADIDSYRAAVATLTAAGGETARLQTNFRSDPRILGFVNRVLRPLFEGSPRQAPWADLVAGGEAGAGSAVTILRPNSPASSVTEARRREARAIAAEIARLLSDPPRLRRQERVLGASDVAILMRTRSNAWFYEDALREVGIPARVEGGRGFFQRPAVAGVIHALAALVSPFDELAVFSALRSPVFGHADDELWAAWRQLGAFDFLAVDLDRILPPGDEVGDSLRRLRVLRANRERRPLFETLEELLAPVRPALLLFADGERDLANLGAVLDIARRSGGIGFAAQVERLRERLDEDDELAEAPGDLATGAVELVTIHKAKGLEWPVVFLVDLGMQPSGSRGAAQVRGVGEQVHVALGKARSPGFVEAEEAEARAALDEEARLLYVAATRAEDRLYVSLIGIKEPKPKPRSLAGQLAAAGWLERLREGSAGDFGNEVAFETESEAATSPLPQGPIPDVDLKRDLADWEDHRERRRRLVPATEAREAVDAGRAFGQHLHQALQRLDWRPTPAEITAAAGSEDLRAHLERALGSSLWKRAAAAPRAFREAELVTAGEAVADQRVDLLIDEPAGLVVVDWKSDAGGWSKLSKPLRASYSDQVLGYRRALEATLGVGRVAECWLVFTATGEEIRCS